MKALSIRQPWAWLICAGIPVGKARAFKDIENRMWPAKERGRIYVHAGQKVDNEAMKWLLGKAFAGFRVLLLYSKAIPKGAIIGEVSITGCVDHSDSPWFVGPYGFTLANPVLYDKPIPCKGKLGFFEPDVAIPERMSEGN